LKLHFSKVFITEEICECLLLNFIILVTFWVQFSRKYVQCSVKTKALNFTCLEACFGWRGAGEACSLSETPNTPWNSDLQVLQKFRNHLKTVDAKSDMKKFLN